DNAIRDIVLLLLEAHRQLRRSELLAAAKRGGEFMLRAQLPDPQPVWAQQYNLQMEPVWARRFEPASVTGGESVGVIRTLVDLYLYTGEDRFLKPIPSALEWFRRSRLPGEEANPRWARFYELRTNRPLYFTRRYELVYTDNDLPTHYSFQAPYGVSGMMTYYERVQREGREQFRRRVGRRPTAEQQREAARRQEAEVRTLVGSLDEQGRWLQRGRIESAVLVRNVEELSQYLAALEGRSLPPREFQP
ncbi:MAG: hypothetical protein FJ315_09320, partial [SAR202 cluster bacterium]|nr:hypothetical protein [SAR202 cluster bacterium]